MNTTPPFPPEPETVAALDREKWLEAILDSTVDAMINIGERGVILALNPAAERMFGYTRDQMVGQNVTMLMPEPHRSAHDGYLARYRETRLARVIGKRREVTGLRQDGTTFPLELAVSETVVAGSSSFTGILRDLTERNAARKQLHLLEKALQSAHNAVVISNSEGRIEWVNDAFTTLTGYSCAEAIGARTNILKSNRQAQPFYARLWQTIQAGQVWCGELENRRKDGTIYPEEMTITPVRDDSGAVTHFIAIKQDISERKRLERMKSEFVSTVSHELRTPLTSIRGSLGLLAGGAAGVLPAQAQSLAQIASNNSERLVRLINDILDIERIESGRMNFSLRPVPLAGILQDVVAANQGFAAGHGASIVLQNALTDAKVLADPDRLNQVVTNLVSNAAKFSPQGGTVLVSVATHPRGVRISVADSGQGIPDEFRARIFGKFSQADSSDARKVGGSGLGLSISKVIVERLGGEISFDSERGRGTAFHVDLPLWTDAPILAGAAGDAPCVLICEDDTDTARIIAALLESRGLRADLALSAEEAWQKLGANRYAAMTLDLKLPGQDGLSLLRQIRGEPRTADLPVVVVSGRSRTEASGGEVAALDVADWLLKPIDGDRLANAVRRVASADFQEMPRVLHVEDDPDIVRVVAGMLAGVARALTAPTLADARRQLAQEAPPDLILLDIGLPDGCGLDLLPEAAARGIPVVIFSAQEPDADTAGSVAAVLVKSKTDNAGLVAIVEKCARHAGKGDGS
ncbi:MAG: PAS domain S-box protein [Sulfuritalea sp.]|nr:PAS domain S-box protein [Sulfuritalea sp.]